MSDDESNSEGPWSNVCAGLLVSGANVWLYYHITAFEKTDGEEGMHWVFDMRYHYIGKLGVLAITGTIAISVLFRGIYRVIFERHLIPKIYASIAFFPRFQT